MNSYEYDAGEIKSPTGFLYARPSFLEGAARAFDLGGTMTMFNESLSGEQADFLALSSDWQNIGNDIREAMRAFARLNRDPEHARQPRPAAKERGRSSLAGCGRRRLVSLDIDSRNA